MATTKKKPHRIARAAHRLPVLFACLAAAPALALPDGCDSIASVPIRWNINYSQDIQTIFSNRCANCHVDHAGSPSADLDLDPKWSYENLVNAPSWAAG